MQGTESTSRQLKGMRITHVSKLEKAESTGNQYCTIVAKARGIKGVHRVIWFDKDRPHMDRFTYEELTDLLESSEIIDEFATVHAVDINPKQLKDDKGNPMKGPDGQHLYQHQARVLQFADETLDGALWSGYRAVRRGHTRDIFNDGTSEDDIKGNGAPGVDLSGMISSDAKGEEKPKAEAQS